MTTDTPENFDTNAEAADEQRIAETNVRPINGGKKTIAAQIMAAPAAAMTATPEVQIQRCLDILPGLVGGIDAAIKDQTGKHQPFVLLIFAEGTALHSANFGASESQEAVIELAQRWDTDRGLAQMVSDEQGNPVVGDTPLEVADTPAANDPPDHVTH
jgi:hypothetical protein